MYQILTLIGIMVFTWAIAMGLVTRTLLRGQTIRVTSALEVSCQPAGI